MSSIKEIYAGIQEKSIEREIAVKKFWEDVQKKRKEMVEYTKKMGKISLIAAPVITKKIEKPKVAEKKPPKKYDLKEEILDVMGINEHRTMDFLIEKLNKSENMIEQSLQDLARQNRVLEREAEADNGSKVSLWMRKT